VQFNKIKNRDKRSQNRAWFDIVQISAGPLGSSWRSSQLKKTGCRQGSSIGYSSPKWWQNGLWYLLRSKTNQCGMELFTHILRRVLR